MAAHAVAQAASSIEVKVPYMHAFPSREARLGGWEKWEAHMLHINRRHIIGIDRDHGYIVMVQEDVFAMAKTTIEAIMAAAQKTAPRVPRLQHVSDWFIGTWRYLRHAQPSPTTGSKND